MQAVEPIRNLKKLKAMIDLLKGQDKTHRNATLVQLGIHTAYRISDLLNLKYENLFYEGQKYKFREYIKTKETKTKKWKQFKPPERIKNIIKAYCRKNKIRQGDWIFPSLHNRKNRLDRINAYKAMKKAAEQIGIKNFGTHSLRKTFGYHYYQKTKDIATLMKVFNHSSQKITLRYTGIEQEGLDKVYTEIGEIYDL